MHYFLLTSNRGPTGTGTDARNLLTTSANHSGSLERLHTVANLSCHPSKKLSEGFLRDGRLCIIARAYRMTVASTQISTAAYLLTNQSAFVTGTCTSTRRRRRLLTHSLFPPRWCWNCCTAHKTQERSGTTILRWTPFSNK
jgi:hypothetical protein